MFSIPLFFNVTSITYSHSSSVAIIAKPDSASLVYILVHSQMQMFFVRSACKERAIIEAAERFGLYCPYIVSGMIVSSMDNR